jgi:hypothetical protein
MQQKTPNQADGDDRHKVGENIAVMQCAPRDAGIDGERERQPITVVRMVEPAM